MLHCPGVASQGFGRFDGGMRKSSTTMAACNCVVGRISAEKNVGGKRRDLPVRTGVRSQCAQSF